MCVSLQIFSCQGFESIFLQKLYEIIKNDVVNNSSRVDLCITTFKCILGATQWELSGFFNFSCVLSHKIFRCQSFGLNFLKKLYGIFRNDVINYFSMPDLLFMIFRSILGAKQKEIGGFFFFKFFIVLAHILITS